MLWFSVQGIIIFNVVFSALSFSLQSLIKLESSQKPKADFGKEKWLNARA